MTTIERRARLPDDVAATALQPRRGLVKEEESSDGSFAASVGPVAGYERRVTVSSNGDGTSEVHQRVTYRLDLPILGWLVSLPARRHLGRVGAGGAPPWWGPADTLDRQAWEAVGALAAMAAVVGYLSTLLGQTLTYAAVEFKVGTGAEGVALAIVRGDILLAIGLVAAADRRGRRVIALWGAAAGCVMTAVGGVCPSLPLLVASQVVARGLVTGAEISATVLVAESMPRNARAWAVGVFAMSTAVGAGACVLALPITGVSVRGWRFLYLAGLLWLLLLVPVSRHLRESVRFAPRSSGTRTRDSLRRIWGRRLAILAAANFCLQAFTTPSAQFSNEYLRRERGFSPGRISLFIVLTVLPGAIGIVVGGRLADTRGRRRVVMIGAGGSAVGTVIGFWAAGWPMWAAAAVGYLTGAAIGPALGVYGPELFATELRGTANGVLTGVGRVGSVLGLLFIGWAAAWFGRFGPAFGILSFAMIVLVVLVGTVFPETAHRSLEELNPEDAPTGPQ